MSPSVAQAQTKNNSGGGGGGSTKYGDITDSISAVLMHQQQQQQQPGQVDMSMDNRSMLAGHYGGQQNEMSGHPHAVETNFDVDGNVETETKSISSVKSTGSAGQEATTTTQMR